MIAYFLYTLLLALPAYAVDSPAKCPTALEAVAGNKSKRRLPNALVAANGSEQMVAEGTFRKYFDPNLKTMVYHTASEPDKSGNIPLVDPKSKAVIIFFHGSGTAKSSGKTFLTKALPLSKQGVAGISIDLPFHGESKFDGATDSNKPFLDSLHSMIGELKKQGKRVVLAGHSMGPDIAADYAAAYPKDVDHIVLFSPSPGQSPSHAWMYENVTEKAMHLLEGGNDIAENVPGGEWAGVFGENVSWTGGKIPDSVNVTVVVGEFDEWWAPRSPDKKRLPRNVEEVVPPGDAPKILGNRGMAEALEIRPSHTFEEGITWFKENIPHVDIKVVRGYGHYIFEAPDPRGGTVMLRALLDAAEAPYTAKPEGNEPSARLQLKLLAERNSAFREWLGSDRGILRTLENEAMAKNVLKQWNEVTHLAWRQLLETDLEKNHPEYFANRRYSIAHELANSAKDRAALALVSGKPVSLEFIADFRSYMAAKEKGVTQITPDPRTPSLPKVDAAATADISEGNAGRFSIRHDVITKAIAPIAESVTVTDLGPTFNIVSYRLQGKDREVVTLKDNSQDGANQFVTKAYFEAIKANNYLPFGSGQSFKVVIDGVRVEGKVTKGDGSTTVISGVRLSRATE